MCTFFKKKPNGKCFENTFPECLETHFEPFSDSELISTDLELFEVFELLNIYFSVQNSLMKVLKRSLVI